MLGSMPDGYILCHQPSRTHFRPDYDVELPKLPMVIDQYEDLMKYYKEPKVHAVALNTFDLSQEQAASVAKEINGQLNLPTVDPIRDGAQGVETLWNAIEPVVKKKLGK